MNRSLAHVHKKRLVLGVDSQAFKRMKVIFAGLIVLAAVSTIAQSGDLQEKLAAVKRAAVENKRRLMQYQWTETAQLALKGDEKPPTQYLCQYGPDGQIQKTPIGPPAEQPSSGRMKQRIIEKKKAEMKDYMQDVKSLLAMYVPPDPDRMQQAYQAGNASLSAISGAINLTFTNYAQPGDKMVLTFDTTARKITALHVNTFMGEAKDAVSLSVQMGSLPDGTNYPQQTVVTASAKQLTVTTTNSNYQKL